MIKPVIKVRKRFFIAAEGESEQSFIKLLQYYSDEIGLHVHLDCKVLNGGGYKSMFSSAVNYYTQGSKKGKYQASFMLIDSDRESHDDNWPIHQLRQEALLENICLCVQHPNIEGTFLRMHPNCERYQLADAKSVMKQLDKLWPNYKDKKPVDAQTLKSKFSLNDLRRAANVDDNLKKLLIAIGLL